MKNSRILTAAIAVLLVGALAAPAYAGVEEAVVVVQGTAKVGSVGSQPQSGEGCGVSGKGLHFPTRHGGDKTKSKQPVQKVVNKRAFYSLDIPSPQLTAVRVRTNPGPVPTVEALSGELHVCGIVDPGLAGIGAACGSSTGHSGRGKAKLGPDAYDLTNVGWVTALGGLLPVYGHIQEVDAATKAKKNTKGTFHGGILATGAGPCNSPKTGPDAGGATDFEVVGLVVATALDKKGS